MGATVFGLALPPETTPALFSELELPGLTSTIGDIRDLSDVTSAVLAANPTVAIHMAAQPLVRRSYREPGLTFSTNVMGTVNVLEALRHHAPELVAALVVTTDKVYANDDSGEAFVETDRLGGHDPYSSSKAACEEVVSSYRQSFYDGLGVPLATARAGNVIGGGDWSEDRLIPDLWRAMEERRTVVLRNPDAVRPWQHVLDPICGYLKYVEAMASARWGGLPRALNFAPLPSEPMTVREVAETLGAAMGAGTDWELAEEGQPAEMKLLALDASLANECIGWSPQLTGRQAVQWTAEWIQATASGAEMQEEVDRQISRFEALLESQGRTVA
jgi:CDP-glucose 4,6-dehydratase